MSFFKKALSSIGIGSAKVDARLRDDRVSPGGVVSGVVDIRGGGVDQQIGTIYMLVKARVEAGDDEKKVQYEATLGEYALTQTFTLKAGENKEIPFEVTMPLHLPLTVGHSQVWIQTGLDIKQAVDPTDTDYLRVVPDALQHAVFDSLERMGLRLREAKCIEAPHFLRLPCVQEFEFVPQHGAFRGRLDEVELFFVPNGPNELDLFFEIDRRKRGLSGLLSEAMNLDETKVRLTLHRGQRDIYEAIAQVIARFS